VTITTEDVIKYINAFTFLSCQTAARLWNDGIDNSVYLAPITYGQLIFKSVHASGNVSRPNIPNTSIIPNKTRHVVAVDDLISTKL
jgi:hypothetical protein